MYLVLGAGRMAKGIVHDLYNNTLDDSWLYPVSERITVWDKDIDALKKLLKGLNDEYLKNIACCERDLSLTSWEIPQHVNIIISTLPYEYSVRWTEKAIENNVHFIDLGGNNDVVEEQFMCSELAKRNNVTIVPDCGLAPGVVSILAMDLLKRHGAFNDSPSQYSIEMSVGGLPLVRDNPLEYQIVFSPHGLINEYIEPTTILDDGSILTVPSMTGLERFEMPWGFINLEKFYTSGGASTLPQSLKYVCRNVSYKTIRYAGHAEKMRLLLDLFGGQREALEELLAKTIPLSGPDVILLDIKLIKHYWNCSEVVDSHTIIDYPANELTAMARMTAFPASIIAQAIANGTIVKNGTLKQEELFDEPSYMIEELQKRGVRFLNGKYSKA